jgi:hypothetical protein
MVDARRHDLDPRRICAVELGELGDLRRAIGEDRVGTGNDLGLGPHSQIGLGVAGLGLDASEGVEGRDERQRQFMLQSVTDHPREPVVGMERLRSAVATQMPRHSVAELVEDRGEVLLGQVRRAGIDMHDPESGFDVDDLGEVIGGATDVDLGANAGLRECAHEFAHVHVHPPGITGSRLGQGGGVEREHRERSHDDPTLGGRPRFGTLSGVEAGRIDPGDDLSAPGRGN